MQMPPARLEPRTAQDHVGVARAQARHGLRCVTTNAVTRSGWFVGVVGGLLALQVLATQLYSLEISDLGVPYHDGPCAGKIDCPELGVK